MHYVLLIFFFFETGAKKFYPNLLIKKKRIAQLIYRKPGQNQVLLILRNALCDVLVLVSYFSYFICPCVAICDLLDVKS
jgi:hypothetical protein